MEREANKISSSVLKSTLKEEIEKTGSFVQAKAIIRKAVFDAISKQPQAALELTNR